MPLTVTGIKVTIIFKIYIFYNNDELLVLSPTETFTQVKNTI